MSKYGDYLRTGKSLVSALSGEKPHSSITDWIEVLSSDKYEDDSLDGVPELVESINIQGFQGTGEASRAIRKKLKYGNVHRQIRALVILRALTENCSHGFQVNWSDQQIMERLRIMAQDNLIDPKVRKRLILVFHAWSIQYADEPRMRDVAGLYRQYAGGGGKRTSAQVPARSSHDIPRNSSGTRGGGGGGGFSDSNDPFEHSWDVAPGQRGKDTYADLGAARADAEQRKREREAQIALERREAELERREREVARKREMAEVEARRRREAEEEEAKRRRAKADRKAAKNAPQRPKFDFAREKPAMMNAVATAIQAASNLVNSCRQINREAENITENPRVANHLDKAKAARRPIIRYIQLVSDEEYIGTLLDANEKIVEAIQLYDKLSKPAALDSDSDSETKPRADGDEAEQVERIRQRLAAQKLEATRTGELQALQDAQKIESKRQQARTLRRGDSARGAPGAVFDDLAGLDFKPTNLPAPMRPDTASDTESFDGPSLSDFSDYDSSDDEYRAAAARSRGHSRQNSRQQYSEFDAYAPGGSGYSALDEETQSKGLLDPNDPFGDPFGDDNAPTPRHEKQRMEWAEI